LVKIVIIIPFFGEKLPDYFSLYLKSISYNNAVDFMLFTDIKIEENIPPNLIVNKLNIEEFNILTYKNIGINPKIVKFYYKLCDLRPLYGKIFQDYILDYNYWGYGDLDLIYGNLGDFLHKKVNEGYQIISLRKEWLSGSTCLFRNSLEINELYLLSKDWQKVLSNPNIHYGFDEVSRTKDCKFLYPRLENGEDLDSIKTEIDSFTSVVIRNKNKIKTHFENVICEKLYVDMLLRFSSGDIYVYKKGKGNYEKNTSFVAFHFVNEKGFKRFRIPNWKEIPDEFKISYFGFHHINENVLWVVIKRHVRDMIIYIPKALVRLVNKIAGKCGEIIYAMNKPFYFCLKRMLKKGKYSRS